MRNLGIKSIKNIQDFKAYKEWLEDKEIICLKTDDKALMESLEEATAKIVPKKRGGKPRGSTPTPTKAD